MAPWPTSSVDVNGVTISYVRTGGPKAPAVLLHGLMGSGATWTPVARLLEGELDVVMPDARGHGGSSAPDVGYRYGELAADVVGLIHELRLSRPVLIGHSMGGMTAALAASRMGRLLRGLVLVDPTFLSEEWQREVYASNVAEQHRKALVRGESALLKEGLARQGHRPPELVGLQVEARLRTSLAAFDILRPPNPSYRKVMSAVDVPVLLIIGDRPVVSLDTASELYRLNSRVRVEQVDDAGHGLPFDQPEKLAISVLTFMRELTGAA